MTNAVVPMTKNQPVRRGFASLPCILCGDADGNVSVSLEDTTRFHCSACDTDFDADAVRWSIKQWQAVLSWIDTAPIAAE